MSDKIKLPELPKPDWPKTTSIYEYTADQMQAYARDAVRMNTEELRAEVERLTRYYKNGIDCFANPCEKHSGEKTPPFAEFFEEYGGKCLICVVDENKALLEVVERLGSMTAVTMGVGSGDGNLFVHGNYDSIKAVQALVFRADKLAKALRTAEAALADIGDADREPGDDVAWCEQRAAQVLPVVRAALRDLAKENEQ